VLTDPGQVEHEGLLEFEAHLVAELLQQRVLVAVIRCAAEVVIPVRRPGDLDVLAADQRLRSGDWGVFLQRCGREVLVVICPRFVVVVDARQLGIAENGQQLAQPPPAFELQAATPIKRPASAPALLVFIGPRIALSRAGFHVVEPDVLDA
jgi:hypothetical protein